MDEYIKRWQFTRSETIEILKVLTNKQLQFKPDGEKWQTLYHQFGCIGRTQLIYAKAAATGNMDFTLFSSNEIPNKDASQTQTDIFTFLKEANKLWLDALSHNKNGVKWPDGNKRIELHIMSLAEHERIHHGQIIAYFTFFNIALPTEFRINWAL